MIDAPATPIRTATSEERDAWRQVTAEAWEMNVPDELRSSLVFNDWHKWCGARRAPGPDLWEWATSDLRRLATLVEVCKQLQPLWRKAYPGATKFVPNAPTTVVVSGMSPPVWEDRRHSIYLHTLPSVYYDTLNRMRHCTNRPPLFQGTATLDALRHVGNKWGNRLDTPAPFTVEMLQNMAHWVDVWNSPQDLPGARASSRGPLVQVFPILLSLHEQGVRHLTCKGVTPADPRLANVPTGTNDTWYESPGTFVFQVIVDHHPRTESELQYVAVVD